jgi:tetratricopeptide (TPR) repeat protein
VRNNLGLALLRLGRTTEAREQFELALRYEPDFAAAHRNLADLLADSHLWSEAVGQYEAALRLDPGNAETHFNLSLVLSNLGRDAEAEAQFREAVRLRPDIAPRPFYAP